MGIRLKLAVREGWKATDNNRWGEAMEVRFVADDGRVVFRYCPKCDDKQFWVDAFALLETYDKQIKSLRQIVGDIEGLPPHATCGECQREAKPEG